MKSIFYLKKKSKIALLLFCVMACSILINLLEDKSIKDMNASYKSLYNDRLVPSILLHEINIIGIEKNQQLASDLSDDEYIDKSLFEKYNSKIDSIINIYEQTYLVDSEEVLLEKLKANIKKIQNQESLILKLATAEKWEAASSLYELEGKSLNLETTKLVTQLMEVHIKVGHDMMDDVDTLVSGTKLYSSMQIGLAIVIGLLIMSILFTVKSSRTAGPKDFHLN